MAKLGVNIDHVATLREARRIIYPDPVKAALIAEEAGADSIVAHLREDRRHIKDNDIKLLRNSVKTKLNLEMSINKEIVAIASKIKPDQATLVPEKREEITTEGGLDIVANFEGVKKVVDGLRSSGIIVSLFINPDIRQIEAARTMQVDAIELHTGEFANAKNDTNKKECLHTIQQAVKTAVGYGLTVHAGHGLNYQNVKEIAEIPHIEELNIGHSIISQAVFVGLTQAVKDMKALIG